MTDCGEFEVLAAAIVDNGTVDVDALLADIASTQRRAGRAVCGLVMTRPEGHACAGAMVLVDIETCEQYLVSQPMGRGSMSCRVDPQGFAHASRVLRSALAREPDFVVANRFGGLETEGDGFAAEMLELMAAGVPLLTAVSSNRLDAWKCFSGGAAVLPATPDEVSSWLERAIKSRSCAETGESRR